MAYSLLHERRDDAALNHALLAYRTPDYRHLSTSPPGHSPLAPFAPLPSPNKRKLQDPLHPPLKRRRDHDDNDSYDLDPTAQGAKHWTDDEKSKLFTWLMGPANDDHWNALRATKNSCLRECAVHVFGSKKTYQALKGCYERNFNLFKQIYAFEQSNPSNSSLAQLSETDRLREYERRLATARKQGSDVGNITARTIEHWHRRGWYDLFYRRWHGDPATTRPSQSRNTSSNSNNQAGPPDDTDADDQQSQQQQQPQPQPQQQQQQQQQQQAPTNTPNTTTATTTTTTVDFSATDPTIHGFTPQLTYISPQQTLRDNPLVPPSPATVPTGPSSIHSALNGVGMTNNAPSTSQRAPHLFAGTPNMTHSSTLAGSSGTHHQVPVSTSSPNGMGAAVSHALATSNSLSSLPSSSSSSSASSASSSTTATTMSSSSSSNDSPVVNISITQNMLSAYMQFLQVQTQTGKMKLEYLRRREEREEKEMFQRREMERIKLEREAAEFEHSKQSANIKQKADRAIELLTNSNVDNSVKHAASEFLKRLFTTD